jgi:CHAT domain-containing protein
VCIRFVRQFASAAGVSILCAWGGPAASGLAPGEPVRIVAPAAGSRCFPAKLSAGDYAQLSVSQDSGDLAVEIRSPAGAPIARVDAFEYGVERASLIAPADGVYRFCVAAAGSERQPLRYTVKFAGPRAPQPGDTMRVEAERLSTESRKLGQSPGAENLRRAIEGGQKALRLWESLGDTDARVAILIDIGDAFQALGDFPAAIERYRLALDLNPPGAFRPAIEALTNSGVASMRLGDVEAAGAAFDRGLALSLKLKNPFLTAAVENNRANLSSQSGEFQPALDSYVAALPAMRATDRRSEAVVLGNIAMTYASLGEYLKAESWLERSLPLLSAPKDRVSRAVALMNLGRVRALGGDLPGALPPLEQALTLVAGAANPRTRADVLNNLGQLLYKKGDARGARPLLAEAAGIYRTIHDARGLASATHYSGVTLARLGEAESALASLRESLQLRLSARLDDDAVATLIEIARIERRRSDPSAAREDLERAMKMIEKLRVNVASPDLRATWFASRRAIYEEMLDLLFEFQPTDNAQALSAQALEVAERARSRSWMDELGGKRYEALHMISPELAGREQRITRSLAFKSQQLAKLPSAPEAVPKRAALSGELDDLELQYESLASEIAAKGLHQSGTAPAPLSAPAIRELLDGDTILLEFALGETSSYLWAVTPQEVKWFRLPPRADIERLARPVATLAGSRRDRLAKPELEARYRASIAGLSRTLLGPVAGLIGDKRIMLSRDGILHYVPFAALPSPGRPGIPLGIAHEISGIPSASTLAALRSGPPVPSDGPFRIALFADPVFSGDPRITGRGNRDYGVALARLPFSLREAEYIAGAAQGAEVLWRVGFAATKKTLADDPVRRSTVLHFATHTRIDSAHPELSGIFLSQVDRNGSPQDGLLSLYEIYDLNLPVELAVLSGCATGLGRAVPGDGFVGLTKAFFYAGAARVLVSLWPVDDEGTALFMRAFYSDLLKPGPASPVRALRAAREALWRNPRWRDPAYWSGFSLEGEWRPIPARGPVT